MIRILALFGLAAGFLLISPELRGNLIDLFAGGVQSIEYYSPYSYVVLGVMALGTFMVSLKRGAQPR